MYVILRCIPPDQYSVYLHVFTCAGNLVQTEASFQTEYILIKLPSISLNNGQFLSQDQEALAAAGRIMMSIGHQLEDTPPEQGEDHDGLERRVRAVWKHRQMKLRCVGQPKSWNGSLYFFLNAGISTNDKVTTVMSLVCFCHRVCHRRNDFCFSELFVLNWHLAPKRVGMRGPRGEFSLLPEYPWGESNPNRCVKFSQKWPQKSA